MKKFILDLIEVRKNEAVTTSLNVAKIFGKRHKNVLRDIDKLISQNKATEDMFTKSEYKGGDGKYHRMYYISKDGLPTLLNSFNIYSLLPNNPKANWQGIYIMQQGNGWCKIGITKEFEQRKETIQRQSGHKIVRSFITDKCSNCRQLENMVHEYFKEVRGYGEWFDVDFDVCKHKIEELFNQYAEYNSIDIAKFKEIKDFFNSIGLREELIKYIDILEESYQNNKRLNTNDKH